MDIPCVRGAFEGYWDHLEGHYGDLEGWSRMVRLILRQILVQGVEGAVPRAFCCVEYFILLLCIDFLIVTWTFTQCYMEDLFAKFCTVSPIATLDRNALL